MLAGPFKPPQDTPPQDWAALRAHLAGAGFALDLTDPPRQFAGGMGNLNYLVRLDGREWVLRRPPPGDIPPGGNDMAREYLILSNLYRAYPPAPRAIHFCGDAAVLGAPFLIMEYRPGLVIGAALPPDWPITPQQRHRLGLQLVEQLANLHAVDPDAVGLGTLGRPVGMLERMVDGWNRRAGLACSSTGRDTPAAVARIHQWLRAHLVADGAPTLLHSDFKLDNVILDPLTLAPRTVIDWDMGTRGDPLVDLATLMSYWTEPGDPQPMQALGQMPTAEPGFPGREDVLQAYAARTGADLSGFRFYRVLAMLKLAVVFLQLHARYVRGEVSDPRFPRFRALAAGLLECTEAIAAGELH